ncbi:hypothetical protein BU16DRAFT_566324 [Lophium mytilinum]|uniref:Uncharacterized protein n=1 Tax=Lophium mytilinum TaxID=390894 RepID=A0A6A6QDD7_9PEZI|nr:hypothetical protein BU16DRAFT_566324 [Lophium mytilinum]
MTQVSFAALSATDLNFPEPIQRLLFFSVVTQDPHRKHRHLCSGLSFRCMLYLVPRRLNLCTQPACLDPWPNYQKRIVSPSDMGLPMTDPHGISFAAVPSGSWMWLCSPSPRYFLWNLALLLTTPCLLLLVDSSALPLDDRRDAVNGARKSPMGGTEGMG